MRVGIIKVVKAGEPTRLGVENNIKISIYPTYRTERISKILKFSVYRDCWYDMIRYEYEIL